MSGFCSTFGFGLFTAGDCASKQTTTINISFNAINDVVKQKVISANQSSENNVVVMQNQNISIRNAPSNLSYNITQAINLKISNTTNLSSTIDSTTMTTLSTSVSTQLDNVKKQITDLGGNKSLQDSFDNLKNNIINCINSSTTLQAAQRAISNTVSVQNQVVNIDFNNVQPSVIEKYVNSSGVLTINQNMVGDFQVSSIINSIVKSLDEDSSVTQSAQDVKEKMDAQQIGLGDVVKKVSGDIASVANNFLSSFWKIALVIGLVLIAVVIGISIIGKAFASNPDSIKAIGDVAKTVKSPVKFGFRTL